MKNNVICTCLALICSFSVYAGPFPTYTVLGFELGKTTENDLVDFFNKNQINYSFQHYKIYEKPKDKINQKAYFLVPTKDIKTYNSDPFWCPNVRFEVERKDRRLVKIIHFCFKRSKSVDKKYIDSFIKQYGKPTEVKITNKDEVWSYIWYLDSMKVNINLFGLGLVTFEYDSKYKKGTPYNEVDLLFEK